MVLFRYFSIRATVKLKPEKVVIAQIYFQNLMILREFLFIMTVLMWLVDVDVVMLIW